MNSIQVYIGDKSVINDEAKNPLQFTKSEVQGEIKIIYQRTKPGLYYTYIILDTTVNFVHYFIVNVSDKTIGDVILPYYPPNPPSGNHQYLVIVGEQSHWNDPKTYQGIERKMDWSGIMNGLLDYSTSISDSASFYVTPDSGKSVVLIPTAAANLTTDSKDSWFQKDTLTSGEMKHCRCILEVQAKRSAANPYAVCAHTGDYTHECAPYYNWDKLPTEEVRAYAKLNKIDDSGSREDVLARIQTWKSSEGK